MSVAAKIEPGAAGLIRHDLTLPDGWADTSDLPADVTAILNADPEAQLYAVYDGTRRALAVGMNDLDTLSEACAAELLFKIGGLAAPEGPWLVQLGRCVRDQGAVLRRHLTQLMGRGTGVFVLTRAPAAELATHLRGLGKVAREQGAPATVFLRFWDPLTVLHLWPHLANDPDRMARAGLTPSGQPLHFLAEDGLDRIALFEVTRPEEETGSMKARLPFSLLPSDKPVLEAIAADGLARALGDWLVRDYAGTLAPEADRTAVGAHVHAAGKVFGFTRKDEFSYLGHIMAHLGGWVLECGQVPSLIDIMETGGNDRCNALKAAFADAWQASYRGVLSDVKDQILADPGWEKVPETGPLPWQDERTITRTLSRYIPEDQRPPLQLMWQRAAYRASADGAPADAIATLAFLSLFLGYRFYSDPFLGRTGPPPADPKAWRTLTEATWSGLRSI